MHNSAKNRTPNLTPNTLAPTFTFIDTISFIAMAAIIFEHSSIFSIFQNNMNKLNTNDYWIMSIYTNLGKYGTLIFFLISGFLLNSKIKEYSPKTYIYKRYKSIFKPWIIFSLIYFSCEVLKQLVKYKLGRENHIGDNFFHFFFREYINVLFYTNYWFVLNLLICVTFLLFFKKWLHSIWIGIFTLSLTLFYSLNIYFRLIPTEHTTAIFGFIFFLWLGMMLNKNFLKFQVWIQKIPLLTFIILTAFACYLSCFESVQLIHLKSSDSFNTLRISNILFSTSVFLLLYKIGEISFISKLIPREITFGLYLIHLIVISVLNPVMFGPFNSGSNSQMINLNINIIIIYSLLKFVIAYLISYLLINFIRKTKYSWIIGLKKERMVTPSTAGSVPHFACALVQDGRQRMLLPD